MSSKQLIEISTKIEARLSDAWKTFTTAEAIVNWNFASEDWCCPKAFVDLKVGGTFSYRMEAKDGSFGFDFNGTFTKVNEPFLLEYSLEDERKVSVHFIEKGNHVILTQRFEAEDVNPLELQESGWKAILLNYKNYTESHPQL